MRNDNMRKIIIWVIVLAMVLVTFASAVSIFGN
jgi:hypothetical protein